MPTTWHSRKEKAVKMIKRPEVALDFTPVAVVKRNLGEAGFILAPIPRFSPSLWAKAQLQELEAAGQRRPE